MTKILLSCIAVCSLAGAAALVVDVQPAVDEDVSTLPGGMSAASASSRNLQQPRAVSPGGLVRETDMVSPSLLDARRHKLLPRQSAVGQGFGQAVSLYAHTALVGEASASRAYIFDRRPGIGFVETAVLTPSRDIPGFGHAVALWGNTAVVSARAQGANQTGAVVVFERFGDQWIEQVELVAADSAPGDGFGSALHLSGDTLIVSAPGADSSAARAGAAYIFNRTLYGWSEAARISASNGRTGDEFGVAVAVWRDVAVVGASHATGAGPASGAAYVFRRGPGAWTETAILAPAQGSRGDAFGKAVALSDHRVLVSAPGEGPSGAAYIFEAEGDVWRRQARLASDDPDSAQFGVAVAIAANTAVVSSAGSQTQVPSVYLFEGDHSQWRIADRLRSPASGQYDGFGAAVALGSNALLVGADEDSEVGPHAGATYVYSLAGTPLATAELTCPAADTLGSLADCIHDQMPTENSYGYVKPTVDEQADWRGVVVNMLAGACSMSLPPSLAGNMQIREFTDLENNKSYCLLMEIADADNNGQVDKGWGTFIFDPVATRELSHQAPHPYNDYNTAIQAANVFKGTNSRTYLMCGAHRYSNPSLSACDPDYNEADCAHSRDNMYYPTVLELDRHYGFVEHTEIQWHGMSKTTCPGINVYISHGLSTTPPADSNVYDLLQNVETMHPSWSVDVPGAGTCRLNATKNTEGRYLNGVAETDVCVQAAESSTNKFVHIEQERDYRFASEWIEPIIATFPDGINIPSSPYVSAMPGNAQAELYWNATSFATAYNVYVSTTSGSGYSLVASEVSGTSYTHAGLSNGVTYYYVVTAINDYGESGYSNEVAVTPMSEPDAPAGLTASGARKKCTLNWDSAANATSYTIKRSTSPGGPYSPVDTVAATTFRDTGLGSGVTYHYVVTAVNAVGESMPSNEVAATTN